MAANGARLRCRLCLAAAVLTTAASLAACLPTSTVNLEIVELRFNEVPELDRRGSAGRLGDARFGPYFDGLSNSPDAEPETVALLYPELEQAGQEALLRSDCYWASTQESFTVAWESLLTVKRGSARMTCDSPATFGVCRLTDPQTGRPIQISTDKPPDLSACPDSDLPSAMTLTFAAGDIPVSPGPLNLPNKDPRVDLEIPSDIYTYGARFARKAPAAVDPFGRCPGPDGFDGDPVPANLTGHCAPSGDRHSTCVSGCALAPAEDSTYQVSVASADLVLKPTILLVGTTGRTIARPMIQDGSTFSWQTTAEGTECSPEAIEVLGNRRQYQCRWHENFSPQVQVERVQIFAVTASGQRVAVQPAGPLSVRSYVPSRFTTQQCAFQSGSAQVEISGSQSGCSRPLVATPTFALDVFAIATIDTARHGAQPMTVPLHWSVALEPTSVPDGAAVFIEFGLRARAGQALVMTRPSQDFGRLRVGRPRGERVFLRNVGAEPAQVQRITLIGPQASDFRFRVLDQRQEPLKAPLDVTIRGNRIDASPRDATRSWEPLLDSSDGPVNQRMRVLARDDVSWPSLIASGAVTPPAFPSVVPRISAEAARSPLVATNNRALLNTRLLPFTLGPGESVEVFVEITPRDYGPRQAYLKVEGYQLTRPDQGWQVLSALHAFALEGPRLAVFPSGTLEFPYPHRPRSPERAVHVDNLGDEEGVRTDIALVGPDASKFKLLSQHAPRRHIPPGDREMFQLSLAQPCSSAGSSAGPTGPGSRWQATLRIGTSETVINVPLVARPLQCFDIAPAPPRR